MSMFEGNAMAQFGASFDSSDFDSGTKSATNSLLALGSATKKTMGAFTVLAGAFGFATLEAIKFHEQMTALRRLAGEDIAAKLGEDILKLSEQLPASRQELIGIAEEAVRLGVKGRSNIRSFTTAVAQLSGATQLNATQAANSIAKIARVTDASIEDTMRLSSVINELSKNYGTSAQEIIKATGKLAPTARQMGFTAEQTLGIAAALNEVNISVRRGATRLRRFFQQSLNPDKQRKIANAIELTSEEFRSMISTSEGAEEILQRVVSAMAAGGESAEILRTTLSSASRQGVSVLAGQLERLPEAMDTAESAFADGTSALREQATQLDTTSEQWDIFAENFKQTAMGLGDEGFVRAILGAMNLENQIFQLRHEGTELERVLGGMTEDLKFMKDEAGLTSTEVLALSTSAQQLKDEIQGQERRELFISQFMEILRENNFQINESISAMGRWQTALSNIDGTIEKFVNQDYIRRGLMNQVLYGSDDVIPSMDPIRLAREELSNLKDEFAKDRDATGKQRGLLGDLFGVATQQFSSRELKPFAEHVRQMVGAGLSPEALLENIRASLRIMGADLSDLGEEASESANDTEKLIQRLRESKEEMKGGRLAAIKLTDAWENAGEEQRNLIKDLVATTNTFNFLRRTLDLSLGGVEKMEEVFENAKESTEITNSELQSMREELIRLGRSGWSANEMLFWLKKRVRDAGGTVEDKLQVFRELGNTMQMGNIEFPDFGDTPIGDDEYPISEKKQERIDEYQKAVNRFDMTSMQAQMDMLSDVTQKMTDSFFAMFDALIDETKDVEDAIVDMIRNISQQLASSIIQRFLFKTMATAFKPNSEGGIPSPQKLPSGGPTSAASGGHLSASEVAIVGERGPELFVPNVSGTVVPNKALRSGGGGGDMYKTDVHFNVKAMDSRDVQRMLDENKELITDRVVEGISKSQGRRRQLM